MAALHEIHSAARARHRVLVVDDDHDLRDSIAVTLRRNGHEVLVAPDGHEALRDLAGENRSLPCVALVDVMMPAMTGLELRARLRTDPLLAAIPVVLMTASRRSLVQDGAVAGDPILYKPMEIARLLAAVERACRENCCPAIPGDDLVPAAALATRG